MRRRNPAAVRTLLAIAAACIAVEHGRAQTGWRVEPLNERCAARVNAAVAHDAVRGQTVAFGGLIYSGVPITRTQIWDGIRWVTPSLSVEPPARSGPAMAFDFSRARTVLFGGSGSALFGDTCGAALPASLDAIGMTGCTLFVSIDATQFAFANGARADFALLVPTTTTLAGLSFYAQAAAVDAAANAAGHVVSNALEGRIGSK